MDASIYQTEEAAGAPDQGNSAAEVAEIQCMGRFWA